VRSWYISKKLFKNYVQTPSPKDLAYSYFCVHYGWDKDLGNLLEGEIRFLQMSKELFFKTLSGFAIEEF
jgi:hypothetical protein